MLLGTLLGGDAWAGACCVGAISAAPTHVGQCEQATMGLGTGLEATAGTWDREGNVQNSSLTDRSILFSWSAGVRLHRKLQIGASIPARINQKSSTSLDSWGAGPGDSLVQVTWEPFEEKAPNKDTLGLPVPVFSLGLRLPSGTSVSESSDPLLSDVTGLEGPAVLVTAMVQRTLGAWPTSLGVTTEVSQNDQDRPISLTASASVGRYLNPRWTLLTHSSFSTHLATLDGSAMATRKTSVGVRLLRGEPRAWRAWLGAVSDVPLDHFGRSHPRRSQVATGLVRVW